MRKYYTNDIYPGGITPDYFLKREEEKRSLKKLGALCGAALLSYILIQYVFVIFIQLTGLYDSYINNVIFQYAADTVLVFASMLLPFALAGRKMKKFSGAAEFVSTEKKVDTTEMVLAIVAGLGLCLLASILSSFFVSVASMFGYELTYPEEVMPTSFAGVVINIIRTVVTAAIAEELSMRGTIMGNLRKFGDSFAIWMAAIIFALMHGNLVQAPFALLCGGIIGYLAIKTGTIWTAVLIHGANNLFSLFISYLLDYADETLAVYVYYGLLYAIIFGGIACFVIFFLRTKDRPLEKSHSFLSCGEKMKAYFLNPAMIISVIYMLYITSLYIN